ncbi:12,18-didecarboxysiroheme deacetylase [Deltaproteobacteria bacterium Smac51]|nr:12,18-didecarboxysiroheme deacetylase [Deltaproteobacteria bacterium Smac51]
MIGISKLYCGTVEASDPLRYGRMSNKLPSHLLQFSKDKKPVVVWNMTRACNLTCMHCYANATAKPAEDELSPEQAFALVDHLAEYGAPVVLFSGGEPMMHPLLFDLIERTVSRGPRAVLSSNGLLIDQASAERLKGLGLSYIGVSLDGLAEAHDEFRRMPGAFEKTVKAMAVAREAGLKVGLRFTLSRRNVADLPGIFDLMEREGIPRVCFYHLVSSGRGTGLSADTLSHEETRRAVDLIIDRTSDLHSRGKPMEVLTVDNHADGPYVYLRLLKEGRTDLAAGVLELLKLNGGNSSGRGIAAVSWNGDVHPDQFWRNVVLGSVKARPFAEIWHDQENEFLMALKNKKDHVTGRCRACTFLEVCGGNLRARAEAATGEVWGEDPACYLTDDEISIKL